MPFRCCVRNCNMTKIMLHQFPQDNQLFRNWCICIGRKDLLQKDQSLVQKNYRVCDAHFDEEAKFVQHHNRTNLKVGSVPTLHLPALVTLPDGAGSSSAAFPEPEPASTPTIVDVHEAEASTSTPVLPLTQEKREVATAKRMRRRTRPEQRLMVKHALGRKKRAADVKVQRKRNLLLEVHLHKKAQLTPKAAKLYSIARQYKEVARKLQYEVTHTHEQIEKLVHDVESFEILQSRLTKPAFQFLQSQLLQQTKKPKDRRFTTEDKIFALALLKQGPKAYRLLQEFFALPSRKTLMALLRKVPFGCGINTPIMEALRQTVSELKESEKHCVLMFDEISVEPSLLYNKSEGKFEGFAEMSSKERTSKIADHAMVFMVKGLTKKWKQPVAYYFTQNAMPKAEVTKTIKDIIRHLQAIGLVVDVTVCDQYNKAAINALVDEAKREARRNDGNHDTYTFNVDGQEIIPLFDFPHLLKGLRNNLLKYNCKFVWKNGNEVASWDHIEALYTLDNANEGIFRMLNKLTDQHVERQKIKKMKVKHAAQVFSHRVGSTMRGLIVHGNTTLPPAALGTAHLLLFGNMLFDSVNGSSVEPNDHNPLRRAVTATSSHVSFWNEAITVLETMRFVSARKEFVPPSVTNWIISLKNMKLLWSKLRQANFSFLLPRNLNQDPLENFFSLIRSHGHRAVNPTTTSFRNAFKALVINNFVVPHSRNANCEADISDGALNSLKGFLTCTSPDDASHGTVPLDYAEQMRIDLQPTNDRLTIQLHGYLCGYMAKRLLQQLDYCPCCKQQLKAVAPSGSVDEYKLIESREYKQNLLVRPRTKFIVLFGLCTQIVEHFLPQLCATTDVSLKLNLILKANINSDIFSTCPKHDLFSLFITNFVHFFCFSWAGRVRQILKSQSRSPLGDAIMQQAYAIAQKRRARSVAVRQQKQLT